MFGKGKCKNCHYWQKYKEDNILNIRSWGKCTNGVKVLKYMHLSSDKISIKPDLLETHKKHGCPLWKKKR